MSWEPETGHWKPWRQKEVGRIQDGNGDELRIAILWCRPGDAPLIDFRKWDVRPIEAKPTRFGYRLGPRALPQVIDVLTKAALEVGNEAPGAKGGGYGMDE